MNEKQIVLEHGKKYVLHVLNKNQLFNQDSFLSSVADGGDNDIEIIFRSLDADTSEMEKSLKIFEPPLEPQIKENYTKRQVCQVYYQPQL